MNIKDIKITVTCTYKWVQPKPFPTMLRACNYIAKQAKNNFPCFYLNCNGINIDGIHPKETREHYYKRMKKETLEKLG